ncbi:MAG: hypothetical protein RLZZ265_3754 [Verrucomicrobiota bacterium]|jgi:adenylate kinase
MNIAAIGTGLWGFVKRIPDWVLWTIAALLFLKFVDINAERRGRRKEADKRDREALEVEREVVSNIQENTDEAIRSADAVREHTSASVLPDGTATLPEPHYRD